MFQKHERARRQRCGGFLAVGEGEKAESGGLEEPGVGEGRVPGSSFRGTATSEHLRVQGEAGEDTRRCHRSREHGEATSGNAAAGLFPQLGGFAKKGRKGTQLQGQPRLQTSARIPAPTLPGEQGGREEPAPKKPPAAPRVHRERRERDGEHTGDVSGQSRSQSLLAAVLAAPGPGVWGKEQPAKSRQPSVALLSPKGWPRGKRHPRGLRRRWFPPASSW